MIYLILNNKKGHSKDFHTILSIFILVLFRNHIQLGRELAVQNAYYSVFLCNYLCIQKVDKQQQEKYDGSMSFSH